MNNLFTNYGLSYSDVTQTNVTNNLGKKTTVEGFDDIDYQNVQAQSESTEQEIVIQVPDETAEPDSVHQYMYVLQDSGENVMDDSVQNTNLSPKPKVVKKEKDIYDTSEWGILPNIYIGSLTVVGLFVLFRLLHKN
jgi:hypothetical protein